MGMNRTPADKSMTKEKAISQGGYYNTDGDWNSIVVLDDYPGKVLRGRVETLIIKDGKVFMLINNNKYRIPGGGFDRGVSNIDQAFMETKEEAKLIIDNIRYSGVTYIEIYDEVWPHEDHEIPYEGTYNEVYVADYKDEFHGYIRKGLSDMKLTNEGKFYEISEVENILKKPHRQALMNMINNVISESVLEEDLILAAQHYQDMIRNIHDHHGTYSCIQIRDIESDDGGYIFAEYNASDKIEASQVKKFVDWCNDNQTIKYTNKYVEEPVTYMGHGFLYVKPN